MQRAYAQAAATVAKYSSEARVAKLVEEAVTMYTTPGEGYTAAPTHPPHASPPLFPVNPNPTCSCPAQTPPLCSHSTLSHPSLPHGPALTPSLPHPTVPPLGNFPPGCTPPLYPIAMLSPHPTPPCPIAQLLPQGTPPQTTPPILHPTLPALPCTSAETRQSCNKDMQKAVAISVSVSCSRLHLIIC